MSTPTTRRMYGHLHARPTGRPQLPRDLPDELDDDYVNAAIGALKAHGTPDALAAVDRILGAAREVT